MRRHRWAIDAVVLRDAVVADFLGRQDEQSVEVVGHEFGAEVLLRGQPG